MSLFNRQTYLCRTIHFLVWPVLPAYCNCRGLLLHLMTLNDTHTHIHTHTHTHIHTHTLTRTQSHTHSHTHTRTHSITHSHTHTHSHTFGWTPLDEGSARRKGLYVYNTQHLNIRGVTGGTDQTSGGCSLCYTIPI